MLTAFDIGIPKWLKTCSACSFISGSTLAYTLESEKAREILNTIRENHSSQKDDDYIVITRTGRQYATTNLEHRAGTVYKNAKIDASGLHILRRTFATGLFNDGARVEEVAAYIGDLPGTAAKYYIAIRKKFKNEHVVMLPKGNKSSD